MRQYDLALRDHVALVTRAADFAARCHCGQVRKGTAAEPYVNHLAEVASLLATTAQEPDAYLVAAGWLHDVLEETATEREELERLFGRFVSDIVAEVTDDKSLPKEERKRLQVLQTPHKSDSARLLKLADKTSNLRSLAVSPPADWNEARCLAYVDWAEEVASSCKGLRSALDEAFGAAVLSARRAIAERIPTHLSS
jgi:(p)ppGpp synthase/HD superfamily hydrolase